MRGAWMFILLVVAYTMVWFLGAIIMFLIRGGDAPSMRLSSAFVLGIFSAILHMVVGCIVRLW